MEDNLGASTQVGKYAGRQAGKRAGQAHEEWHACVFTV